MKENRYLKYKTEDFVLDPDFVSWVLHSKRESDLFWKNFIEKYPEKKPIIKEAAFIVKSLQPIEPKISVDRLNSIFMDAIQNQPSPKNRFGILILRYAAVLILVVTLGGLAYYFLNSSKPDFSFEVSTLQPISKSQVILGDGTTHEFDSEELEITQNSSGELTINNDTLENTSSQEIGHALTHIVIPYGKRSEITLSDGSHIWINSGSRLSYPAEFRENIREVYLTGEAFFDIESDSNRPFVVNTQDIKVRVSGTRFNISSYAEDNTTQTVLESGKVSITGYKLFSKNYDIAPGERMVYSKEHETFTKGEVDTQLFSSWINGYLIFQNEPTSKVFTKLERYYNRDIISEINMERITFSGKLDLKEDIGEVLENISIASSVNITAEGDKFIVKP